MYTLLKSSLAIIGILYSTLGFGQSNLEFAETKTIEFSGSTSSNYSIVTYNFTVPEGQTWKIESARITRKITNGAVRDYNTNNDLKLVLDDQLFFVNSSTYDYEFPYWLESGDHTFELFYYNTWSPTYVGSAALSVLVFNIVTQ